jgi:hypothetical protein
MANEDFSSEAQKNPFMWDDQNTSQPSGQEGSIFSSQEAPAAEAIRKLKESGSTNPFAPDAPQQQPEQTGSFMAGVEAFNRQFGRMAEGGLDLVTSGNVNNAIRNTHNREESQYAQTVADHRIATTVGGLVGGVGAATAFGALGGAVGAGVGAAASKVPALAQIGSDVSSGAQVIPQVVKSAANFAGGGAALGYLNYADTPEERTTNAKAAALVGAGVYGAGKAVGSVLSTLVPKEGVSGFLTKVFFPKKAAAQDLAHRVNVDEIASGQPGMLQTAAGAAERQGIPMTPGQLMQHEQLKGGGDTRNAEQSMRVDEGLKPEIAAVSNEQLSGISKGIKKSLDDMVPGGLDNAVATKNKLYSELDGEMFANKGNPSVILSTIKDNPILSAHLDDINTSSLKNLPDNSFVKVDALKKSLDEKLWNDSNPFVDPTKKMPFYERNDLKAARDDLLDSLKVYDNNPKYVQARELSQQITAQGKYLEILNKKVPGANQGGKLSIEDTYNALFNNEQKQAAFLRDVKATGGNVQDVKDFMTLSGQVSKSPLVKQIGRQPGDNPDVMLAGRVAKIVQTWTAKTFLERYDKAYLALTLGGEHTRDIIKNILQPKTLSEKMGKYVQFINDYVVKNPKEYGRLLSKEAAKGVERDAMVKAGQNFSGYLQQ